ncbi:MAG: nucleotidyl transferase AbiEii/AbiGii toxin family protein [Bacteroidota bacterium]|nr:nucleotidyl transferase AbiEii/AbiGii toxin family protein [Bacteroidota bacterium]
MNISKDISNKIEPYIVGVLCDLDAICNRHSIPFFILGATARDIFFGALFNVKTIRASLDIDFGIQVNRWDDFQLVIDDMLSIKKYTRDTTQLQRIHSETTIVDIVPFGGIENPPGTIMWPPHNDITMRTVGFNEALQHSIEVCVSKNPELYVKVCTPPGLAIMKLNSWSEGEYNRKKKDASDLLFIIKEYINAGNELRLYEIDKDLITEQLLYEHLSARLLGRDVRKICTPETMAVINKIVKQEIEEGSQYRLIGDMITNRMYDDTLPSTILDLLKQFHIGLNEVRN